MGGQKKGEIMFVTYQAEIQSANILRVSAQTNGPQGGDAGHGCRTEIKIEDMGGTIHSIDEVVAGKMIIDDAVTLQD